ncbi:toll/interleukin-1 receptor domain-containing protein [Polaromonas sp. P1(28)-8]|nr:toll/interleukin-1 receptor domain-containing protein [Polaromonas sp. P1(28)-8]
MQALREAQLAKAAIFISHATPQDNDFVRWLGARLELAGYLVWTDLGRLKGGDYFWDKIEKAIREESFRLLAVVSKNSVDKQGVKDEWAVGQTVERSMPGFVIPLRLDDYDFSLLPIGIHRKNVIDFAQGWHKGLNSLQDTLTEAGAPKASAIDPRAARQWLAAEKRRQSRRPRLLNR